MAEFTGAAGAGASNANDNRGSGDGGPPDVGPTSPGKWKPGGRGRPPKATTQSTALSGKSGGKSGSKSGANEPPGRPPVDPYTDTANADDAEPVNHPPSAFQLRRRPDTYPRYPSGLPIPLYRVTRTEDDLANYFAAMRPEDWGHCECYVYKYFPRPKQKPGEPSYVDKLTEGPIDLTAFIASHGSGIYGFTLNDSNIAGTRRTVMYAKVELTRDEHPPKWTLDTLDIDHKDNRTLVAQLVRDGIISKDGEPMADTNTAGMAAVVDKLTTALIEQNKQAARTQPPPPPDPNAQAMASVHKQTIEMLGDANKAAIAAATSANKQGGLGETLQLVNAMASMFKPAPPDDTALKLMLEELKASREQARAAADAAEKERQRNHELQMAALQAKQQTTDPLAQVETVLKLKNLLTGGGGDALAPRNWKEQAIGMLGENLPQILEVGAALVQSIGKPNPVTAAQLAQPGQAQPTAQPQAPGQQPNPIPAQPQPQATAPTGGPNPNPNPTGPDESTLTPEQRTALARIRALQDQLAQHGKFLVNAIKRGKDGYEFAESLINMVDDLAYQRARAYTHNEWMTAIFSFPQLQAEFAGVEHAVAQFVAEFLDYGNPEPEDGTDEQPEPDPAAYIAPTPAAPTPAAPTTNPTRKGKTTK